MKSALYSQTKLEYATEVIRGLCYQETLECYAKRDWLSSNNGRSYHHCSSTYNVYDDRYSENATYRTTMVDWIYKTIHNSSMNSLTAEMAVSYLDRFMVTPKGRNTLDDRRYFISNFRLIASTCLYLAIKIHESFAFGLNDIVQLSNGLHTANEIKQMEYTILVALRWRMNPPTTVSFLRFFIDLIPEINKNTVTARKDIIRTARMQMKYYICDISLITTKASIIAYCSIKLAIACLVGQNRIISTYFEHICHRLATSIGIIDSYNQNVLSIQHERQQQILIDCMMYQERVFVKQTGKENNNNLCRDESSVQIRNDYEIIEKNCLLLQKALRH